MSLVVPGLIDPRNMNCSTFSPIVILVLDGVSNVCWDTDGKQHLPKNLTPNRVQGIFEIDTVEMQVNTAIL